MTRSHSGLVGKLVSALGAAGYFIEVEALALEGARSYGGHEAVQTFTKQADGQKFLGLWSWAGKGGEWCGKIRRVDLFSCAHDQHPCKRPRKSRPPPPSLSGVCKNPSYFASLSWNWGFAMNSNFPGLSVAVLTYTGSDITNRSMRNWASRACGYVLSEKALAPARRKQLSTADSAARGGKWVDTKIWVGEPLPWVQVTIESPADAWRRVGFGGRGGLLGKRSMCGVHSHLAGCPGCSRRPGSSQRSGCAGWRRPTGLGWWCICLWRSGPARSLPTFSSRR